jgi:hypothetical protein
MLYGGALALFWGGGVSSIIAKTEGGVFIKSFFLGLFTDYGIDAISVGADPVVKCE